MTNKTKITIFLVFVVLLGILIYKSPDEAYWLEIDTKDAIEVARTFAFNLFYGDKQALLKMSIDPAQSKIENSNFPKPPDSYFEIFEENSPGTLLFDIDANLFKAFYKPEKKDMELLKFEKLESFIVMTFGYKGFGGEIVEIPGAGRMLFAVGVRFYKPIDNRILPKLVRKVANLPLLRKFTGRMGTVGRWVVFDYKYTYNLRDYIDWVKEKGAEYTRKQVAEAPQINLEEIEKEIERQLDFLYTWGSIAVENQINSMEKLYEFLEASGKAEILPQ